MEMIYLRYIILLLAVLSYAAGLFLTLLTLLYFSGLTPSQFGQDYALYSAFLFLSSITVAGVAIWAYFRIKQNVSVAIATLLIGTGWLGVLLLAVGGDGKEEYGRWPNLFVPLVLVSISVFLLTLYSGPKLKQ